MKKFVLLNISLRNTLLVISTDSHYYHMWQITHNQTSM